MGRTVSTAGPPPRCHCQQHNQLLVNVQMSFVEGVVRGSFAETAAVCGPLRQSSGGGC